jgi:hypothetical protein
MNEEDLKALWKEQPMTLPNITIEDISTRAAKFERTIYWRNVREWVPATLAVPFFGWLAYRSESRLETIGALIVVASSIFVAYVLWRHGRTRAIDDPTHTTDLYVKAHQRQLLDQARLLQHAPWWYAAPFTLGLVIMHLGSLPAPGESWAMWLLVLAFFVVVGVGVSWLNVRAARKLREKAAALGE